MIQNAGAVGRSPVVRVAAAAGSGAAERVVQAARDAADAVPVCRTGPAGVDAYEPLVLATSDGTTAFVPDPSVPAVEGLVATVADGDLPTEDAVAVVEHDPDRATLPVPDDGPLAVGRRAVLGPCGWVDPLAPEDTTLVSTDSTAADASDSGLRGRGRGDAAVDEAAAETWATVRSTDGDPVVVCNANESRTEQRADETLLAGAPLAVLDGIAAVAAYVGAEDAVVYVNEDDDALHRHLRVAVDAVADHLPVVPQLVVGPDEYRAGGPTAALEALEGADRIEPRLQPPTPATHGLYGRPTVVHTPRTFAQVRRAVRYPDGFEASTGDPGTRVLTVTGDVIAPATVELEPDASLAAVREAVDETGAFKMACVGGVLGGITRDLDVAASGRARDAAGLGTDAVVELLNQRRCPLADAGERARFAATANSGRCVPGREGTKQLAELLRDVYDGDFETDKIRELGRVMARSSNCRTGAHAPRPVTTAIDAFEPEFRAHANGRCPSGACTEEL